MVCKAGHNGCCRIRIGERKMALCVLKSWRNQLKSKAWSSQKSLFQVRIGELTGVYWKAEETEQETQRNWEYTKVLVKTGAFPKEQKSRLLSVFTPPKLQTYLLMPEWVFPQLAVHKSVIQTQLCLCSTNPIGP